MTVRIECAHGLDRVRAVTAAAAAVRRGDLVIVPTENAYVLATDAFSARGAQALRQAKGQALGTPAGVLVPRAGTVTGLASDIPVEARALMTALWPGMVTLLLEPQPTLAWDRPAGSPIAVRVPGHPVALALIAETGPVIASAVTDDGEPVRTCARAMELHPDVTIALDAGTLDARWSPDEDQDLASTVVDMRGGGVVIMRHGAISEQRVREAISASV